MPDAFMRRCVFHHIEFNKSILDGIVNIYDKDDKLQSNKENITKLFTDIRGINGLNKKPGIAEFISWIVVVSQGKQYNDSVLMNVL
ncbi:MAG: hypothetical protein IPJ31_06930 [Bacteroidetes bacterium]|nr:hypothetical protein [Bacteroidota bacterium]